MKSCRVQRKPALDSGFRPAKEMGEYEGDRRRSRSDSISENRRSRSSSRGRLDRSLSRGRLDRSSSRGRIEQPPPKRRPERSESRGNLGPLREERENSQSRLMKSTFSSRSKSRDRSLHPGFQTEPKLRQRDERYSGSQTLPRNSGKERRKSSGYGGYNPSNDSDNSSSTLPRNGSRGRSPPKSVSKTWISPTGPSPPAGSSFTPSARPIITPDTLPSYTARPSSRMSPTTDSLSFPKTLPFGATSNFGGVPSMAPPSYAPFRPSKSPERAYGRSPTPDRQIPIQIQGRSMSRDTGLSRSNTSYSNNNTEAMQSSSKFSSLSSSSSSYAQKSSSMLRSSSFKENEGYKSSSHMAAPRKGDMAPPSRKGVTKIGLSALRKPIIEDPVDKPEPLGTNNNRLSNDTSSSNNWSGTKHMSSSVSNSMSRKSSYSSHVM